VELTLFWGFGLRALLSEFHQQFYKLYRLQARLFKTAKTNAPAVKILAKTQVKRRLWQKKTAADPPPVKAPATKKTCAELADP
jgi:hypothetical protein